MATDTPSAIESRPFTRLPAASCIAAALSALAILVLPRMSQNIASLTFWISAPLALTALVLGTLSLFVARRRAYSITAIILSALVRPANRVLHRDQQAPRGGDAANQAREVHPHEAQRSPEMTYAAR